MLLQTVASVNAVAFSNMMALKIGVGQMMISQ